ncbi:ankyrin repeat domain-containing protein [Wolbachia endosymbiont of Folsomia candida]|uniref:ankyrin repeat domain-containing protein n=1 Tax=Wolbachia endosymbiont of Folsomia candida TaxID=169402 RepID=UPI000B0DB3F2|nr:ankyrin repeat domain-containing protein [Wolbachia endosymbiont of Folsomia candida]APR97831.1 ankyrin repeat domain-containing protein [Wolbachia endosymbiont of Folsomia candida]
MNRNLRRILRASSTGQYDVPIFLIVLVICVATIYSLLFSGESLDEIDRNLRVATKNCDLEAVEPLIKKNVNTKGSLSISERALHYAAGEGCLEITKFLLDEGADINAISGALHEAARGGQLEIVKLLLEKGANPHLRDWKMQTAKTAAVRKFLNHPNRKKPYREIIDILRDAEKRYESK